MSAIVTGPLFEMRGLASVDAWVVTAILTKAFCYAAALLAMGGVIYRTIFSETPPAVMRSVVRLTMIAALAGVFAACAGLAIVAARISGMGLAGAIDPMMLDFAWQSPKGTSSLISVVGFLGILCPSSGFPRPFA